MSVHNTRTKLNGTELNWRPTSRPSYTTHLDVFTGNARAAKLGRLVLSEFCTHVFQCGYSQSSSRTPVRKMGVQFSLVDVL